MSKLPNKFKKGDGYSIPYSKFFICFGFVFISCFGVMTVWLLFSTKFARSTSIGLHGNFGRMLYDNPALIKVLGGISLIITLLLVGAFIRILKTKHPFLAFDPDGLFIGIIMPESGPPIPWKYIRGYSVASMPYTWWKNCIYLNVKQYEKYTDSIMGSHIRAHILVLRGTAKLKDVTLLLDHYISDSFNSIDHNEG